MLKEWKMGLQFFAKHLTLILLEFLSFLAPCAHFCYDGMFCIFIYFPPKTMRFLKAEHACFIFRSMVTATW